MSGERTEAPTPRRLQELSSRGNTARSHDLTSALALFAALLGLTQVASVAMSQASAGLRTSLSNLSRASVTADDLPGLVTPLGPAALTIIAGVALPAAAVALVVGLLQSGGNLAFRALRPDPGRLNPLAGLRRLMSVEGLAGLIWPMLKLAAVCLVVQGPIRAALTNLPSALASGLGPSLQMLGTTLVGTARDGALALVCLSVADVFYRRWQFMRQARMSRQELRDELRQTEGDPGVRSRIRSLQRRLAQRRMMHEVPNAQVVITNPTHFAVALAYDSAKMSAPEVVAKGADLVAARIVEVARQHRVPIVPNAPLARALYRSVDVGQPIPAALYQAVAEVLAYVYTLRRRS